MQSLSQEAAQLKASERQVDSLRETAIALTERNLQARAGELARRQSLRARELHLALDSASGTLYLRRDGVNLRAMPVTVAVQLSGAGSSAGPLEASAGAGVAGLTKGKHTALRLLEGDYRWAVPERAYREYGEPEPAQQLVPAALGPAALLLDDGTVLYAQPAGGPLNDGTSQLPRSIVLAPADLEAVKASLCAGLVLYLY